MPPRTKTRRTQGVLGGRSERVVRQVLEAAVSELADSGYAAFRMDAVCATAGVNKTTIYRRWPSRAQLVASVVEWMRGVVHDVPLPDTGALEADLVAAFERKVSFKRRVEGRAWARLLAERHDPEVEAIIGGPVGERGAEWYAMVERAIERGELPRATDARLLLRMISAIVDAWNAQAKGELERALLVTAVRTVVAGARAGTLTLSRRAGVASNSSRATRRTARRTNRARA